ncbi:anhydro-N-acetylmuramic acid kinase [Patiriisocius marinus]|uniref:anhydro-N-acetylmuramic acid kinase n=1 Tax=Patiriisocius marinus TaxID=1397112 RepID=UPI00232BB084|nr:anhydro-N-acetylmuramic acid kinase [Patiriisocius marinus]
MKKEHYKVLGVMSGTSLDGVDLAVCEFVPPESSATGKWEYSIGKAETLPYNPQWKQKLQQAINLDSEALKTINEEYTSLLADYINAFITKHKVESLDAVCSHGHTILHQPKNGITLQIGNLPKISELIQQKVVCDFRVQDVAMGGQGAPLVPIGDQLLFSEYDYCLNLGGFANVSLNKEGNRLAYDICPVNIVLNVYAEKAGVPYDDGGDIANSGKVLLAKSSLLNGLSFYKLPAPKSLGLEWVLKEIFPILDASYALPKDTLRTFTDHAAFQIARQFKKGTTVLVTGGGAYNTYLLIKICSHKDVELVVPSAQLLEFKEALIFGFLGVRKLRGEVNCLASVTGAKEDHSSGVIYKF